MALIITITTIINYIIFVIVIIITIILIENVNNNILFRKKIFAYCPKVTLVETGFEPENFEFSIYQSNYLTRPNDALLVYPCF